MDVDLVQLESSLWVGKKRYRAALTEWHLNWTELDKKNRDKTVSVPVSEIVAVEEGHVEVLPQRSVSEDTDRDFTVFYVKRSSNGSSYGLLWRLGRTQFSCPSRDLRDQWMTQLRIALKTHSKDNFTCPEIRFMIRLNVYILLGSKGNARTHPPLLELMTGL
ncbi:unnamed protein product [Oncorhynchus mykiss]|uniref:Ceramide kinase PH domain-containing protein n=1 Tax=Oncorhynchus mykiss TaxID=8022 RepID=A0A060YCQ4_ONCMY|nr:unnamed protein product [Oncorhynchus mykiss]